MCLPFVLRIPVGRADTLLRPYRGCSQPAYVILAARLRNIGGAFIREVASHGLSAIKPNRGQAIILIPN